METAAFSHATSVALAVKTSSNDHLASFSSGDKFGWITNGDRLEVFNASNGGRMSSMIFGADRKKKCNTIITAVCECIQSPYLIVGTVTDDPYTPGSIVHLFNARTSQIAKSIAVPYEVTSLEFILLSEVGRVDLHKRMDGFDGIIALGTYGGHIYLLDLKLSQKSQTSEKQPGTIVKDRDITRLLQNSQHVAVWLGASKEKKSSDLHVSSMKYMGQTSLLAVGLSNGYIELWDLISLQLVYDNFVGEPRKGIMVNNFVFQEPENDPRNVCCLWVFYTPNLGSPKSIGEAFLLQMLFQGRIYDDECGFIYEDFLSAFLRFSHPLCSDLDKQFMAPSKLLCCASFSSGVHDQSEDGSCQDVMVAVWQETEKRGAAQCYLMAFDLNKWYHCQMPSAIESGHYMPTSEIIVVHRLDMLKKVKSIVHVKVAAKLAAENQDCNGVLPLLDFDIASISFSGLAFGKLLNAFTQLSNNIQKAQHVLFNKTEYYEMCYRLREFCNDNVATGFAETSEHFSLLSVITDNGAVGVLISIVRQLSCARVTGVESYLTLEHIIEWSKYKLHSTKKMFNNLVIPLLEFGPTQLDKQSLNKFNKCKQTVQQLVAILSEITAASDAVYDSAKPLLYSCLPLALHVEKFIIACSWYLTADPACFCHGILIGGKLTNHLVEDYNNRRREYKGRKLAIDFVISEEGSSLEGHFKTLSGTPNYPPTNLETLLGLYLLPDASIQSKHFISLYFLKDLLVDASELTRSHMLMTFASQLNISQSFVDLVQASWHVDHQQFKESYRILQSLQKDETIHPLFYPNLVRGFLIGNELENALNASRKFLLPLENEEACCVYMEALALNGKIGEAYVSLKNETSKFKDCFTKVMSKYGKEDLLKEVLKTPMMSDSRCQTYFEAFKSVIPVNVELFNESNLKVVRPQVTPWFKYRRPVTTVSDRKETKNVRALASKISEKEKSKKDTQISNDENMLRSFYINLKPKISGEDELNAYLEPRTFDQDEMAILKIPVPSKMLSPKGLNVHYSSILSKARSTSSGDSILSPKQLRFAEPDQNKFYIIDDESKNYEKNELSCLTVDGEEHEETLELNNVHDDSLSNLSFKSLEETTVEAEVNTTFEIPMMKIDEVTVEEIIEPSEIEEPVAVDSNKSLDVDQVSVCTNEVSEAESYITADSVADSLKRPPLKRSRKSQGQAPPIATRRSSRLSTHANGNLSDNDNEPQQHSTKRMKVASSDPPTLTSLKEVTECDSKEDESEVKDLPDVEDAMKTPVKLQSVDRHELSSTRKSIRVSKRSRTDDEEEQKTPGKRKCVDTSLCKTPSKSEVTDIVCTTPSKPEVSKIICKTPSKQDVNEGLVVAKTPRSTRRSMKILAEDGAMDEKKKCESPSRKSSRKEKVVVEEKNNLSEKTIVVDKEEYLTSAQKAIRMRALQRKQEAAKAPSKTTKSKDHENTNPSDLPELKFSDPIIKEFTQKVMSPDKNLLEKSSFTFSPPLTRFRQRRTKDEDKQLK